MNATERFVRNNVAKLEAPKELGVYSSGMLAAYRLVLDRIDSEKKASQNLNLELTSPYNPFKRKFLGD